MSEFTGSKYGTSTTYGTGGGVVTWSIVGAGVSGNPQDGNSAQFSGTTVALSSVFNFDYEAQLRAAFALWSAVADIDFIEVTDPGGTMGRETFGDIRIGATSIDGFAGEVANTLAATSGNNTQARTGDMVFDADDTWFWTANSFFIVAVHEIGHALGLAHEDDVTSIMATYYNSSISSLQADDISGITTIYGSQTNGANSYTLSSTRADIEILNGTSNLTLTANTLDNSIKLSSEAEAVIGDKGNDTISGNGGNDIIWGDLTSGKYSGITYGSGSYARAANDENSSIAAAIDVSALFSISSNSNITNSTSWPHVTITGTGDETIHYYALVIANAGSSITLDVDGASFDTYLQLLSSDGTVLSSNDTAATSNGASGSTSTQDAYFSYTTLAAGTYYIAIGGSTGSAITTTTNGGTYQLHISVNGEITYLNGDDTLDGGSGNDTIYAGYGADTITGGTGDDTIDAGGGDDTIYAGSGADNINGGAGTDTLSFANSTSGVSVSLANSALNSGDAAGDIYSNIESVHGSGYADTIAGDSNDNTFEGGAGSDAFSGAGGTDTVTYEHATAAVTVSLASGGSSGADAIGDTFSFIENLTGSDYGDTLTGDDNANVLKGGAGNDSLYGNGGDDTLYGGSGTDKFYGGTGSDTISYSDSSTAVTISLVSGTGSGGDAAGETYDSIENVIGSGYADTLTGNSSANTLSGGAGDDVLDGGAGADTLYGGRGTDTVTFANATASVIASLATSSGTGGDASGDVYSSIENLIGSSHGDTLTGDSKANVISGGAGNDTISGGDGADTLVGGAGSDTFDGGNGADIVSYASETASVTVSLTDGGVSNAGNATGDRYTSIEGIIGTSYNDTFIVASLSTTLSGGAGTDTLYFTGATSGINFTASSSGSVTGIEAVWGSSYGDTITTDGSLTEIRGEGGDDIIVGSATVAEEIDGGTGSDTISYADASSAITLSLSDLATRTGAAALDTISNIENIIGTSYGDSLAAANSGSTIDGGNGADTIYGGTGNDTLYGSGGNDSLYSSAGSDKFYGGDGTDTLNYSLETSAVTVNLSDNGASSGGAAVGDTYYTVENVTGTGYGDTITGDGSINVLSGGDGDDTINAGSNNDTLYGGAGNDSLNGGSGTDAMYGGMGDDTYTINISSDTVVENAGEGTDTVTASGINIDISAIANVENATLTGSSGLTIKGNALDNALTGNTGSNKITGGGGNDTIDGLSGSDTAVFSGTFASYTISADAVTGRLTVVDNGSGYNEGTDTLSNIDYLQFSDTTVSSADWFNHAPTGTPTASLSGGSEDAAYTVSSASLLIGISDADGDGLSVASVAASNGTVVDNGNGTWTITPEANFAGTMTLTYSVQDARGGLLEDLTRTYAVNNTNDAPTDIALSANVIAEGSAGGSVIGTLSATDIDTGDSFTFSLTESAAGRFSIDASTGEITVASPLDIDYEQGASHSVTVQVADAAGATFSKSFTISVTDVAGESITGDGSDRTLKGGIGDDSFQHGTGTETFAGGIGNDTYNIGNADTIVEAAGEGSDTVKVSGSYTLSATAEIEYLQPNNLAGTGGVTLTGNDYGQYITGNAGANTLYGGGGNDTLEGLGGSDTYYGGTGTDTVVLNYAKSAYTVYYDSSINEVALVKSVSESEMIYDVEYYQFTDGTYSLAQLVNHAPTGTPTGTVTAGTEDTNKTVTTTTLRTGISDSDGDTLTVTGLSADHGTVATSGTSFIITPEVNYNGTMTLTYSISDSKGGVLSGLSRTYTVSAVNDAPTSITLTSQSIAENSAVGTVVGALSATDPDTGNTFTYSLIDNAGGRFAISGTTLTVASSLLLDYEQSSSHNVTIRVTDNTGKTLDKAFAISVTDVNPEIVEGDASANTMLGGYEADSLTGGSSADTLKGQGGNDTLDGGADNDTAVFSGNLSNYAINFNEVTEVITVADMRGGAPDGSDQVKNIEYLQFADGTIAASTYMNHTPTGAPTATLANGMSNADYIVTAASLLTGFSDSDGDTLSIAAFTASHGTVTSSVTGSYTITPQSNFLGVMTLTYTVSDGRGGTLSGQTRLYNVVANQAPTGVPTATLANGTEDVAYTVAAAALLQGLSDPEEGALSLTSLMASTGTVTNNGNGTYTITQASNFNGNVTLTYGVSDPYGATLGGLTRSFTLNAVNDTPTAISLSSQTISENAPIGALVGNLSALNTADPGETFAFSLLDSAGGRFAIEGSTLVVANGVLLDFEQLVSHNVTVRVTDSGGATFDQVIAISVADIASEFISGDAGDNTLYGGAGEDTILGLDGNDTLVGGAGSDQMTGGKGNDLYDIDLVTDIVTELAGEGTDTVRTATLSLKSASYANVEQLVLTGSLNLSLTGNSLANTLAGNSGSNTMTGASGKDTMTGNGGRDVFDFNFYFETGKTAATRDVITDFQHSMDDIDLRTLDASTKAAGNQAFVFNATKGSAFKGEAGDLRWYQLDSSGTASDKTIIEGDINGDKKTDFQIELTGLKTLTATDFLL